jgi:hypothetical protein
LNFGDKFSRLSQKNKIKNPILQKSSSGISNFDQRFYLLHLQQNNKIVTGIQASNK